MSNKEAWHIDEFVSFELRENEKEREFTIILKGKLKYSDLIAGKVNEIIVTKKDIDEYVYEGCA